MSTVASASQDFFVEAARTQALREVAELGPVPGYFAHMVDVAQRYGIAGAVPIYRDAQVFAEGIDRLTEDEAPLAELEDAYAVEAMIYGGQR